MKPIKHQSTQGQLLIEILAAFVLMTFLLTGLVGAGLYALRNVQYSNNRSQATKLASQQLERLRVKRDVEGVSVLPSCSPECYVQPDLQFGPTVSIGPLFVSMQIVNPGAGECPIPAGGSGTAYKAISTVQWDMAKPTPRIVSVESCLSDWKE